MPQRIPDNSYAPEESCNKIKKDCHAERRHINHGEKVTCEARDAAGHIYEVIVRGTVFGFFKEPGSLTRNTLYCLTMVTGIDLNPLVFFLL